MMALTAAFAKLRRARLTLCRGTGEGTVVVCCLASLCCLYRRLVEVRGVADAKRWERDPPLLGERAGVREYVKTHFKVCVRKLALTSFLSPEERIPCTCPRIGGGWLRVSNRDRAKAPEGWCPPPLQKLRRDTQSRTLREGRGCGERDSVLECGGPPPLLNRGKADV